MRVFEDEDNITIGDVEIYIEQWHDYFHLHKRGHGHVHRNIHFSSSGSLRSATCISALQEEISGKAYSDSSSLTSVSSFLNEVKNPKHPLLYTVGGPTPTFRDALKDKLNAEITGDHSRASPLKGTEKEQKDRLVRLANQKKEEARVKRKANRDARKGMRKEEVVA